MKDTISATVEIETIEQTKKMAEENKRSFSQMVDILLCEAIETRNNPYEKAIRNVKD